MAVQLPMNCKYLSGSPAPYSVATINLCHHGLMNKRFVLQNMMQINQIFNLHW